MIKVNFQKAVKKRTADQNDVKFEQNIIEEGGKCMT